jgi:hypothetical protein
LSSSQDRQPELYISDSRFLTGVDCRMHPIGSPQTRRHFKLGQFIHPTDSHLRLIGLYIQTDATFAKFLAGIDDDFQLPCLRTLKIRQTSLTDASLNSIISFCPNLKCLDLSFTPVRRPPPLLSASSIPALEKLSLTSTRVASSDLLAVVTLLPQLRTLSLGALGGGQGSSAAIGNSSAMTMNDETLYALTDRLESFHYLEDVNLVGNTKLGITASGDGALLNFISRVGRKCKVRSKKILECIQLSGSSTPNRG